MNKDQLKELLDSLTTSFTQVATTITNSKKDPEDQRELTYTQEKGHQKKLEEELGNLFQKIEQIDLNYTALSEKCSKEPCIESRWKSNSDQEKCREVRKRITCYNCSEVGYIAQHCLSKKTPRISSEHKPSNYIRKSVSYSSDEGWKEDEHQGQTIEVPISYTGTKSLREPRKDNWEKGSSNMFDEFTYEDEQLDEIDKYYTVESSDDEIDLYSNLWKDEISLAIYLTLVEEVTI
ncbi:5147_t:CDS:2 [Cetraspora pellucida]|uniref:5147_t:CDS:1 n=1 Tax=Cetraspora pellucida TaxID=1433469 RepID=A0A9N9DFC3_9GLOM|nr:5147_t:CDS:2 [Cetraspora pellucida]